ncbi:hypothetical protein DsansV1_C05g0058141 [Dioscorea sansibarensis]
MERERGGMKEYRFLVFGIVDALKIIKRNLHRERESERKGGEINVRSL